MYFYYLSKKQVEKLYLADKDNTYTVTHTLNQGGEEHEADYRNYRF